MNARLSARCGSEPCNQQIRVLLLDGLLRSSPGAYQDCRRCSRGSTLPCKRAYSIAQALLRPSGMVLLVLAVAVVVARGAWGLDPLLLRTRPTQPEGKVLAPPC
jgi:hypothetical protein